MSSDMNVIDSNIEDKESTLVLPINKKDLGNFIYGLLGQQQSIERELDTKFDIDHDWVMNLHELINQRILQQTNAKLVSFISVIYFKSGLKRTFTTVEAFKQYSETKKLLPVGIKIIWHYLVHFPNKEFPEKQQITFSAHTHYINNKNGISNEEDSTEHSFMRSFIINSERSTITFQIDHTERTWGDDLEVIIANHVGEIIRKDSRSDFLFQISRLMLAFFIVMGSAIYLIITSITDIDLGITQELAKIGQLSENKPISINLVNRKLDGIANMIAISSIRGKDFGYTMLYLFLAIVAALAMLVFTRKETHSFLVFSKEAVKYKKEQLRKESRSNLILLMSFIASIIASIIANYGYSWLLT